MVARIGSPATRYVARLVTGTPAAAYEMRIRGSTSGMLDANLVSIRKLTKRIAIDFSGNRYRWYLENDSSADYIVLTAL
jgi:alpha-D-ribose 1-methylphosphonate 5-triphosphate diphosphatase PhnM